VLYVVLLFSSFFFFCDGQKGCEDPAPLRFSFPQPPNVAPLVFLFCDVVTEVLHVPSPSLLKERDSNPLTAGDEMRGPALCCVFSLHPILFLMPCAGAVPLFSLSHPKVQKKNCEVSTLSVPPQG